MKIIKKFIYSLKKNWKLITFAIIYIFCFFFMFGIAFDINSKVKGSRYSLYSILFLSTALLSFLPLLAKQILQKIFGEEAHKVAKRTSIALIPIGIISGILTMISFFSNVPSPLEGVTTEFGQVLAVFIFPIYILFPIIIGGLFVLISFIAFSLLRLVMRNTKVIVGVFLASSVLWFFSLGNINLPISIHTSRINNPQVTFQNMLFMNLGYENIDNSFFIRDDKIYAYVFGIEEHNNRGDEFFSADLEGKNIEVISNSERMRYAQFLHVDNNEAYYHTTVGNSINKINLDTGRFLLYIYLKKIISLEMQEKTTKNPKKRYTKYIQSLKTIHDNYEIEDVNSVLPYMPKTISVRNIKTNEKVEYDNTIHWNFDGSVLYLLRGKRENFDIYAETSIIDIHVDKIMLE